MPLDHLWATWRSAYVGRVVDTRTLPTDGEAVADGRSLFERILAAASAGEGEEAAGVLHRGPTCFALLNRYPYTSGHLMVLPQRAAADLGDLDHETAHELWDGVRLAVAAIRAAYAPDGVNVGINLGAGAGAGIPDHLHVHCLPRWSGDTNFMTAVAETRVLPEPLAVSFAKLRAAWPAG